MSFSGFIQVKANACKMGNGKWGIVFALNYWIVRNGKMFFGLISTSLGLLEKEKKDMTNNQFSNQFLNLHVPPAALVLLLFLLDYISDWAVD